MEDFHIIVSVMVKGPIDSHFYQMLTGRVKDRCEQFVHVGSRSGGKPSAPQRLI